MKVQWAKFLANNSANKFLCEQSGNFEKIAPINFAQYFLNIQKIYRDIGAQA